MRKWGRPRAYHTFSGWIHFTVGIWNIALHFIGCRMATRSCWTQMVGSILKVFSSIVLQQGLRMYTSNKFPDNAATTGPGRRIWEPFEKPRGPSQSTLSKTQIWRDRLIISFRAHPPPSSFSPILSSRLTSLWLRGLRKNSEDFPCGLVVKTSPSNAGDSSSIPGQRARIPHAKNKNVKQKQYCIKFSKEFKNGPQQKNLFFFFF